MVVVYTEKNRYIDTKDGRELNFSIVFLIELTESEREIEREKYRARQRGYSLKEICVDSPVITTVIYVRVNALYMYIHISMIGQNNRMNGSVG